MLQSDVNSNIRLLASQSARLLLFFFCFFFFSVFQGERWHSCMPNICMGVSHPALVPWGLLLTWTISGNVRVQLGICILYTAPQRSILSNLGVKHCITYLLTLTLLLLSHTSSPPRVLFVTPPNPVVAELVMHFSIISIPEKLNQMGCHLFLVLFVVVVVAVSLQFQC